MAQSQSGMATSRAVDLNFHEYDTDELMLIFMIADSDIL